MLIYVFNLRFSSKFEIEIFLMGLLTAILCDNVQTSTLIFDVMSTALSIAHTHTHAFLFTIILLISFTKRTSWRTFPNSCI